MPAAQRSLEGAWGAGQDTSLQVGAPLGAP